METSVTGRLIVRTLLLEKNGDTKLLDVPSLRIIVRDLLIFVGVIAALLIALIVVVSMIPNTNPLKRVLAALCYRLDYRDPVRAYTRDRSAL